MSQIPMHDSSVIAPLRFLAQGDGPAVLAVITAIEGPSYRPLGAMMALASDGGRIGTLSSGCVEADIALHAETTLADNRPKVIKYGRGSPFVDIQLPCGGGLEITLLPNPDKDVLTRLVEGFEARIPAAVSINLETGELANAPACETGHSGNRFFVSLQPETFFYVFGKGPEAATFASLVQSAGFPNILCSPDLETLEIAAQSGVQTRHLTSTSLPAEFAIDAFSAVVLFFHDHDWEPPILAAAAGTEAFYIGAQGSQRAAAARRAELSVMGVSDEDLARIRGPIGLIPSARDARKLAVSVLAEVMHAG